MATYYEVRVTDDLGERCPAMLGRFTTMQQAQDYLDLIQDAYADECPNLVYFVAVIADVQLGGTLACLAPILVGAYKYAAMVEGLTREGLGRMPDLPPKSGYTCVYPRDDT